jgi:hypothetical protein
MRPSRYPCPAQRDAKPGIVPPCTAMGAICPPLALRTTSRHARIPLNLAQRPARLIDR